MPPEKSNLEIHDDTPLPNLTLVRDVVPEVGQEFRKRHPLFSSDYSESVVGESRFGDPGEEADLSCVYVGLREVLPNIDILSTSTFWERVGAPNNSIELPELFVAPQSEWLRAIGADILVIGYHARIDLENTKMEIGFEGAYDDTDKETAAIIVIDLHRKSIIHGSRITFEDKAFFYHTFFIVPFGYYTSDPPDMCNTVAQQAGLAIAETMPDRPIRALVVVAGEEPVAAAEYQYGVMKSAAEWGKLKRLQEEELRQLAPEDELLQLAPDKLLRQAQQGNANAQLVLFKDLHMEKPDEALVWLCRSADSGNREARVILAEIYEHGGSSWIKKGIVERNEKLAYVWYVLSDIYDWVALQFFADLYLTPEQLSDAVQMLEEWQPGNCERELGLAQNN